MGGREGVLSRRRGGAKAATIVKRLLSPSAVTRSQASFEVRTSDINHLRLQHHRRPGRGTPMRRGPSNLGSDGLPIVQRAGSSRPAKPQQQQQQPLLDSGTSRSDGSSAASTPPPRKTGRSALTMPTLPLPKPLPESRRTTRGRLPSRAEDGDLEESSTRSDGVPASPAQERPSSTPAR